MASIQKRCAVNGMPTRPDRGIIRFYASDRMSDPFLYNPTASSSRLFLADIDGRDMLAYYRSADLSTYQCQILQHGPHEKRLINLPCSFLAPTVYSHGLCNWYAYATPEIIGLRSGKFFMHESSSMQINMIKLLVDRNQLEQAKKNMLEFLES